MLAWTVIFLLIAVVAGALGFRGIEGVASGFAKTTFIIAITLFLLALIFGWGGVTIIR